MDGVCIAGWATGVRGGGGIVGQLITSLGNNAHTHAFTWEFLFYIFFVTRCWCCIHGGCICTASISRAADAVNDVLHPGYSRPTSPSHSSIIAALNLTPAEANLGFLRRGGIIHAERQALLLANDVF